MKKGTPPCGLYLRTGSEPDMDEFMRSLRQAALVINRSEYEKNMHVLEISARGKTDDVAALVQLAQMEGLVAILDGDAVLAKALNADGILLASVEGIKDARGLLGDDAIIGVACGTSRPFAEQAKEGGADYVRFGAPDSALPPPVDLLGWWSTLTNVPALISGPITNDNAEPYVKAGATFLDASDYVWDHPKGVMQGTVNMLYAIDLAAGTAERH